MFAQRLSPEKYAEQEAARIVAYFHDTFGKGIDHAIRYAKTMAATDCPHLRPQWNMVIARMEGR